MGLNTTPTHGPLLRSWTMPSILGPPKDAIEAEMRRTTFWLAYCYERWQAASTGWAMGLDDEDISQVLSLPQKDFEQGVRIRYLGLHYANPEPALPSSRTQTTNLHAANAYITHT